MPDAPAAVDSSANPRPTPIHDRLDRAKQLRAVAHAQQAGQSQRAALTSAGVARSTLRHWNAASPAAGAPAALAAFVETPEGVVWLRQLLVAAHWCISDLGAHHSTDLFHLQHAVSQAMSLALKRAGINRDRP